MLEPVVVLAQALAVVRDHDDEGVLELTGLTQAVEEATELRVEVADLSVVAVSDARGVEAVFA